jgi:hypothetical protein
MRGFRWLWPPITCLGNAENAAKIAAGAALFLAVVTGGLAAVAVLNGRPQFGIDGLGLVDATIYAFVAWRIRRYSFPWAIAGLVLYLFETFWGVVSLSAGAVGIVTVAIVLAFIGGVRGTYFIRNQKAVQPELTTTSDTERVTDFEVPNT